jgi:hypothetical protein
MGIVDAEPAVKLSVDSTCYQNLFCHKPKTKSMEEHRPRQHLGTNPVMKAGQRPPTLKDEWAKSPSSKTPK